MSLIPTREEETSKEFFHTVKELSARLGKAPSTIRKWIETGKIDAEKGSKGYLIPFTDKNGDVFINEIRKNYGKPRPAYNPKELSEYSGWHELLDELCWLLKVCYSPESLVKKKLFRSDIILGSYIQVHGITLKKVKTVFAANQAHTAKAILDDLKRGWYNELAYLVPLKKSTLGLSFRDINLNNDISSMRFAFPSWRVITAYYSVYFYLRAVTLQKFKNFRLKEHGATITCFKNNLLNPLSRVLWKFPFDIAYQPGKRVYRNQLLLNNIRHLKFQYARHPRPPNFGANKIFERIYETFRRKSRTSKNPSIYMLFDFLHDFRVWANYQNIDDLLSLWGTGYKAFIDQNLSLILFMIGGITEISVLAVLGPNKYLQSLQNLYDLFALNNPQLETEFVNTPLYQRYQLYRDLGFVDQDIKLKTEIDTNKVVLLEKPTKKSK
jgi:hypothetical protein